MHIVNKLLRIALLEKLAIKATDNSDMYSREFPVGNALFFFISAQLCRRSHAVCGGGGTDSGNVAGTALQRWHGVFRGGLQRDDGAGRGTGGDGWGTEAKSFLKSPKMPKLLDRGNGRAYYFGRRTAEKRLFIRLKVSFT